MNSRIRQEQTRTTNPARLAAQLLCLAAALWGSDSCLAADKATLQQRASELATAFEKANKAVVGISAVDLRTGKPIVAFRAAEPRIPASNQKLLTSAFALARLGSNFKFTTSLYLAKKKHLIILGDYDPLTGDPQQARRDKKTIYAELDRWAAAVKKKTGPKVGGDIFVLGFRDRRRYRHPDWKASQHRSWYAAPVGPVNFNDNCLDISIRIEKGRVVPTVCPDGRFISVVNRLKHKGNRNRWNLKCSADGSVFTLTGRAGKNTSKPVSAAVDEPALLCGRAFADRLVRAGVKFSGRIRVIERDHVQVTPTARPICRTVTPLADAMKRANKRSLNMAAECIFLRAGDGTWSGSARIMTETLKREFGLKGEVFTVRDGGGLSNGNRVCPCTLTKLLAAVSKRKDANVLLESLPVGGVDGSIAGRFKLKPYRGRVLGKTGYIASVSCMSGYVLDEAGKPAMAFSILINRVPSGKGWLARRLQESLCRMLMDKLDGRKD